MVDGFSGGISHKSRFVDRSNIPRKIGRPQFNGADKRVQTSGGLKNIRKEVKKKSGVAQWEKLLQIVSLSLLRFARNFECNFCSNWKKNEGGGLVSCWSEKMSLRHHRFSCLDTPSPIICACARLWLLSHHPWGWPYHGCSCRLAATWSFPLKCFDNGQNSSIERRPDIGFSWPCFARITKINFSSIF